MMNKIFFWGTMLNSSFTVLYMIFGVLAIYPYESRSIMQWISNGFFYCCALSLIISCLILLNAVYRISIYLKDLADFVINKTALTIHVVAFLTMIIGLISSNIFMIVGGKYDVT